MKELHITMGLPASGKSTWSETVKGRLLKLDHTDIEKEIKNVLGENPNILTLDGLFLTNNDIKRVLNLFKGVEIETIYIHYRKEDKLNCLFNDSERDKLISFGKLKREKIGSCIVNAKFEKIDLSLFKDYKIVVEEKEVFKNNSTIVLSKEES